MALRAIVEMKAKPGQRQELLRQLAAIAAATKADGFLGAAHHTNLQDPDCIVGIYSWRSEAHRQASFQAMDPKLGQMYGAMRQLLADPMRVTLADEIAD